MFDDSRRRRALRRVKPGDGRPLQPFRWWQMLSRSLFYLPLTLDDGTRSVYAVDVSHTQRAMSEDGKGKAGLYLDGRQQAESSLPATFSVPGGVIEVAATAFGLKRCHYVTDQGLEHQLVPDEHSAEGRRARLDRERPALSRQVGLASLVLLVVSGLLGLPQIVEVAFAIPPVAEQFGTFTSPVDLPVWFNIALGLGAVTASTERALRLRYSWLDIVAD